MKLIFSPFLLALKLKSIHATNNATTVAVDASLSPDSDSMAKTLPTVAAEAGAPKATSSPTYSKDDFLLLDEEERQEYIQSQMAAAEASNNIIAAAVAADPDCSAVGKKLLKVTILNDSFPEETSWYVTDLCNTCSRRIIMSGGGGASYELIETSMCVSEGQYQFTINDSFEDGICCGWGSGYYTLQYGEDIGNYSGEYGMVKLDCSRGPH